MKHLRSSHTKFMAIAFVTLAASCSGYDGSVDTGKGDASVAQDSGAGGSAASRGDTDESDTSVLALVAEGQPFSATPKDITETKTSTDSVEGGQPVQTEYTCYDGITIPTEFPVASPNASVLWPGSLVQGASVPTGSLNPVPIAGRKPLNLYISDIVGGVTPARATVENPSGSSVTAAINGIVSTAYGKSAQVAYEMNSVSSFEELKFHLGMNFKALSWSAGASLSTDWSSKKQHVYVKLQQRYYTVAIDNPQGAEGFFLPSVTAAELAPYVGTNNPLGYIDSVGYGRQFIFLYETEDKTFDLKASLEMGFKSIVTSASVQADTEYKNNLSKVSVNVLAIGGDQTAALQAAQGGAQNLRDFLIGGGVLSATSPGAPIGYSVRYASDGILMALENAAKYCITTRTSNLEISPESHSRLCPEQIGGDREFNGHGPNVTVGVKISHDAQRIWADVSFHLIETKSNWTEAQGNWTFELYKASAREEIVDIVANGDSFEREYTDSNHSIDNFTGPDNSAVESIAVMGDTGGDDIGSCTSDDSYLTLKFRTMTIRVRQH